jgi:hypothetical protein
MRQFLISSGLLLSAFSPLLVILALVTSPFPDLWANVVLAIVLALPMLLLIVALRATRALGVERLRTTKVRRRDGDNLSLVSSFILPIAVAVFAPEDVRAPASLVVLVLLAVIYWRGGLQYLNPVLIVGGYHVYAVDLESGAEVFVLSRARHLPQKGTIDAGRFSDNILVERAVHGD